MRDASDFDAYKLSWFLALEDDLEADRCKGVFAFQGREEWRTGLAQCLAPLFDPCGGGCKHRNPLSIQLSDRLARDFSEARIPETADFMDPLLDHRTVYLDFPDGAFLLGNGLQLRTVIVRDLTLFWHTEIRRELGFITHAGLHHGEQRDIRKILVNAIVTKVGSNRMVGLANWALGHSETRCLLGDPDIAPAIDKELLCQQVEGLIQVSPVPPESAG